MLGNSVQSNIQSQVTFVEFVRQSAVGTLASTLDPFLAVLNTSELKLDSSRTRLRYRFEHHFKNRKKSVQISAYSAMCGLLCWDSIVYPSTGSQHRGSRGPSGEGVFFSPVGRNPPDWCSNPSTGWPRGTFLWLLRTCEPLGLLPALYSARSWVCYQTLANKVYRIDNK